MEMKYIKKNHKTVFIATVIWGILAHGYMYFNKLSWHDDISGTFSPGATYTSGRWFLGILSTWIDKLMGNVSVPLFNGMVSLLFIALTNVLLVEMFGIKNQISCIMLGGLMIVFPSMTATYGYMFAAGYDSFAIFLAVFGIFLVRKVQKWYLGVAAGAIPLCLSLGIYQAYLPLAVTVSLICFLCDVMEVPEKSFWEHLKSGIWSIAALLFGLILYLAGNHICLEYRKESLSTYQNLDTMGHTNVKMILEGIIAAYKEFLYPAKGTIYDMYMQSVRYVYYATILLVLMFLIYHIIQCGKKNILSIFLLAGGAICIPVAINFIYLMGNIGTIHAMMVYAKVMIFVLAIVLGERIEFHKPQIRKCCAGMISLLMVFVCIFYTHYANVCYLKIQFHQTEAISWMTSLITEIKGTEGYTSELPIAYVNVENNKPGASYTFVPYFTNVTINPYTGQDVILSGWRVAMWYWCGFYQQPVADVTEFETMQEVIEMPSYPQSGSIRVIRGTIVVKF